MRTSTTGPAYDAGRIRRALRAAQQHEQPNMHLLGRLEAELGAQRVLADGSMRLEHHDDKTHRPVSLIRRAWRAFRPQVCGPVVKCVCKPKRASLQREATLRELVIDQLSEEIDLAGVHAQVMQDLFLGGVGVYNVFLAAGVNQAQVHGEDVDIGELAVRRVPRRDYLYDLNAHTPPERQWVAHRWRVCRQHLLDIGVFEPDVISRIDRVEGTDHDDQGNRTRAMYHEDMDLMDRIAIWQVIIYDGPRVLECYVPDMLDGDDVFLVPPREHEGPEGGPLIITEMERIGDGGRPLSPALAMLDLHESMARMGQKIVRESIEAKQNPFYHGVDEDAISAWISAPSGKPIQAINPRDVTMIETGGPIVQQLIGAYTWYMESANNEAINLQQTLGVGQQGERTASEAVILSNQGQQQHADQRTQALRGLTQVMGVLSAYIDMHPMLQRTFAVRAPNGQMAELTFDARTRRGEHRDFTLSVVPYFQQQLDPLVDLERFVGMVTQLPAIVQRTVATFGPEAGMVVLRAIAAKAQIPELEDMMPTPDSLEQLLAMALPQPQEPTVTGVRVPGAGGAGPGGAQGPSRTPRAPRTQGQQYGDRMTPGGV